MTATSMGAGRKDRVGSPTYLGTLPRSWLRALLAFVLVAILSVSWIRLREYYRIDDR